MYIAIVGQIINYKQIQTYRHQSVHDMLERALRYINKTYQGHIVSNFTITIGNEFQGLLDTPEQLFEMIDTITLTMKTVGVDICIGIGLGKMTTKINKEMSIGADGPAYWQARAALDHLHKENDYGMNKVAFSFDGHPDVKLINTTISLGEYMKFKWTQSQLDLLAGIIEMGTYTETFRQVDLANTMQLQPKALHKRVSISGIKIYLRSRREVENRIGKLQIDSHS